MLIDIVQQYDDEKKQYLKDLRTQVVLQLSTQQDHKKIVTFLSKVWIINIEDSEKKIYLWFPNEFVMTQAKKVFNKSLKEAIQTVYNPQFSVEFVLYPPFSNWSDLLINLPTLLNIKETEKKKEESIISESYLIHHSDLIILLHEQIISLLSLQQKLLQKIHELHIIPYSFIEMFD